MPFVISDYENEFVTNISPILKNLSDFYANLPEQSLIEDYWKKAARIYVVKKFED